MTAIEVLLGAESSFSHISDYVTLLVIALVILLIGVIIGKVVESLLRITLSRTNVDERLSKLFGARRNYARAIRRTIVRLIYLATVIFALERVRLMQPFFIAIVILAVIVLLASLVLAGLDVIPNIVARTMLQQKKIVVGDEVIFSDHNGVIQGIILDMTFIDVVIRRKNGDIFFVPNAAFLNQSVTKKMFSEISP